MNEVKKDADRRFVCGGYLFIGSKQWYSDPQDYLDYYGYAWTHQEFMKDLKGGCLPVGMIVNVEDYVPMVVTRSPGRDDWKVVPITEYYSQLTFVYSPEMKRASV